jgi:3-isopropylmalate dehydrogenase
MVRRVVVLPGDGIGPEVVDAALAVLTVLAGMGRLACEITSWPVGGAAIRSAGIPLPDATLQACLSADAVLLGAVGDPAFDASPRPLKPETALLALRKALGVYANLRPARLWPGLEAAGPLKPERVLGTDLCVVRELTGGLYFGEPRHVDAGFTAAVNTLPYTRREVERVAHVAFARARTRRRMVTSVDKANVLETSQLWRRVVTDVSAGYPDVALEHMYADACAMALVRDPRRFDIILTENLFGDILSDEAGAIVGSLGLLPSASLGDGIAMYEPVHGSAPSLAGKDVANPLGAILSVAMMLRHSFALAADAEVVEQAVAAVLSAGGRTADLAAPGAVGTLSCSGMARRVCEAVRAAA